MEDKHASLTPVVTSGLNLLPVNATDAGLCNGVAAPTEVDSREGQRCSPRRNPQDPETQLSWQDSPTESVGNRCKNPAGDCRSISSILAGFTKKHS